MASLLQVFCLFSISRLAIAQSAIVNPSTSDLGILQIVTPTTHASQVPVTALAALSSDAASFYKSYTQIDSFDFQSALILALQSQPAPARNTLVAEENRIIGLHFDGDISLLHNPTAYLSRLHDSAAPYPTDFSSSLMSQATGILLGYQSLVSQDVLGKNSSSGPITPGMSIAAGPAATGASATNSGMNTVASASSPKAAGVPMVTLSPLLMINAAAAAVGMLGVALM